jgi:hypothetical protein
MTKRLQIGVMGPALEEYPRGELAKRVEETAEEIGRLLARQKVVVFTGGCDGVMEAALRGAKEAGGLTAGFPGDKKGVANRYCDIEVILPKDIASFADSGMLSSDSLITIPGGAGTLAEVCLAYRYRIPNVILRGFDKIYDENWNDNYLDTSKKIKLYGADTAESAVNLAIKLGKERLENGK